MRCERSRSTDLARGAAGQEWYVEKESYFKGNSSVSEERDWSTPEKAQGQWRGIRGREWRGVDVVTNTSIT